jgi:hypothetical protein
VSNINQHKVRITQLEEEKGKLLPRLDSILAGFREKVPSLAADWVNEEIERRIIDKADRVEKLGLSGVRTIKNEVGNVIHDLPAVAERLLSDECSWPHRRPQTDSKQRSADDPFLNRVFRDLISTLGPVLERHQFMDDDRPHGAWQRAGNGEWRYAFNPSVDALPGASEYSAGVARLQSIEKELVAEKQGLAKARAKDLWDKA